ncbi:type II toxin-antitoxin system RelB/DinJ family antitoxin [Ezakiella peruensis]|uniref:type II toxin-antitoxin system RelB/DinJ family antitoxin n=1 Tax=Ezakiella peruensis TaxID=1464038 RepID=UPI000C1B0EF9|nr:type II toxin-antitoxin system RelB/DinJ family antitoxin [Ezakiella peruensis]
MAKTESLYVRMEPELKNQAEEILSSLGISASTAINMFYRQIVLKRGIPFDLKLEEPRPLFLDEMTKEDLDRELEIAYQQALNGEVVDAREAFAKLKEEYGLK